MRRRHRVAVVPARSGRPRTRRHRTQPQTRHLARQAGPRRHQRRSTGDLTPEARATWEPIFAKYAAPGMCNPDDPEPCTSGTPSQAQIDNDHRSLAQRQHDAFVAVGRIALMSGNSVSSTGCPSRSSSAPPCKTSSPAPGSVSPAAAPRCRSSDVLRLAAHANLFLAVFDKATGSAMDLFRARRVASPGATDHAHRAATGAAPNPAAPSGAYGCQVHHAVADWADDGNTNVDDMGLACGPDNRMVDKDGGWTTQMSDRHDVEWLPPPHLDTGQARSQLPPHHPNDSSAPPTTTTQNPRPTTTIGDNAVAPAPPETDSRAPDHATRSRRTDTDSESATPHDRPRDRASEPLDPCIEDRHPWPLTAHHPNPPAMTAAIPPNHSTPGRPTPRADRRNPRHAARLHRTMPTTPRHRPDDTTHTRDHSIPWSADTADHPVGHPDSRDEPDRTCTTRRLQRRTHATRTQSGPATRIQNRSPPGPTTHPPNPADPHHPTTKPHSHRAIRPPAR